MAKSKRTFFERLTGTVHLDDENEQGEMHLNVNASGGKAKVATGGISGSRRGQQIEEEWEQEEAEGQLTVDVHQTPSDIVIQTMVAGVKPDDLDISITRDMVTIRGKREATREVSDDDYFFRELYWGAFSRTILLPQEIEVEEAEAMERYGLLTIRLPKIDKGRQTKLKVKSNS